MVMVQTIDLILKRERKLSAAERLLDAAGPLFADRPYDAVSTREIANKAKVNLSAISYHFGSKEGLYEAVFKKLIDDMGPARRGLSAFLNAAIGASKNSADVQREVIKSFVAMFIDTITSDENPRWRMQLIIRELQHPGLCFDLVMNGHINVIHDLVGKLIGSIIQKPADSEEVIIITHTVIGICLQYGLNEALLSKRMGWEGFGPREIMILKEKTAVLTLNLLDLKEAPAKAESEYTQ